MYSLADSHMYLQQGLNTSLTNPGNALTNLTTRPGKIFIDFVHEERYFSLEERKEKYFGYRNECKSK